MEDITPASGYQRKLFSVHYVTQTSEVYLVGGEMVSDGESLNLV